jgi:hypothetical protein
MHRWPSRNRKSDAGGSATTDREMSGTSECFRGGLSAGPEQVRRRTLYLSSGYELTGAQSAPYDNFLSFAALRLCGRYSDSFGCGIAALGPLW